jgi:hypothetical protein
VRAAKGSSTEKESQLLFEPNFGQLFVCKLLRGRASQSRASFKFLGMCHMCSRGCKEPKNGSNMCNHLNPRAFRPGVQRQGRCTALRLAQGKKNGTQEEHLWPESLLFRMQTQLFLLLPLFLFFSATVDGGGVSPSNGRRSTPASAAPAAAAAAARPSKTTYTGESCASTSDPALASLCAQREQQREQQRRLQRPKQQTRQMRKQQSSHEKNKNKAPSGSGSKQNERGGELVRDVAFKMTDGEKRAAAARERQFEDEYQKKQQEVEEVQESDEDDPGASALSRDAASSASVGGDGGHAHADGALTAAASGALTADASGALTAAASGALTADASGALTAAASGALTGDASGTLTAAASGALTADASGTLTAAASGVELAPPSLSTARLQAVASAVHQAELDMPASASEPASASVSNLAAAAVEPSPPPSTTATSPPPASEQAAAPPVFVVEMGAGDVRFVFCDACSLTKCDLWLQPSPALRRCILSTSQRFVAAAAAAAAAAAT